MNEQERWWERPTFTGQTDDQGNPLFSDEDAPEYISAGKQEQEPLQEAQALLEGWLERYGGIEYVPRNWGPTVWVCTSCGAETRATGKGWRTGPPEPFPHTVFCKAVATRTFLARTKAGAAQ